LFWGALEARTVSRYRLSSPARYLAAVDLAFAYDTRDLLVFVIEDLPQEEYLTLNGVEAL